MSRHWLRCDPGMHARCSPLLVHLATAQLLCSLCCLPIAHPCIHPAAVWDLASTGLFSDAEGARKGRSVYEILTGLFDAAYGGNRAPVPIYVHTGWLVENARDVRSFVGGCSGAWAGLGLAVSCCGLRDCCVA